MHHDETTIDRDRSDATSRRTGPVEPIWSNQDDPALRPDGLSTVTAPPAWAYRVLAGALVLSTVVVGAVLWFTTGDDGDGGAIDVDSRTFEGAEVVEVTDAAVGGNTDLSGSLQVLEATWTTSPLGGTDLLFLYRNTADVTFTNMKLQIDVFDDDDELIATEIATAALLPPGRIFAASRVIEPGADTVRYFRLTATAEGQSDESDGYWIDVDRWTADAGRIEVRGEVTADFAQAPDQVVIVGVYRDADGRFAGSSFTSVSATAEPVPFRAQSWPNRTVFDVEVYLAS